MWYSGQTGLTWRGKRLIGKSESGQPYIPVCSTATSPRIQNSRANVPRSNSHGLTPPPGEKGFERNPGSSPGLFSPNSVTSPEGRDNARLETRLDLLDIKKGVCGLGLISPETFLLEKTPTHVTRLLGILLPWSGSAFFFFLV
jgi:hypothetical protein